ncbi:hypothetical protein [Deinococcus peraridilitoris]|uniref:Uncharacterized protein n=1 Tax=Deinococcus peraridilitoris (strain DSM 19664 / LMG 22246 / CIP 109416 / KR-200) TaxID=937777 RepID=L0A7G8_DEIPD|nr:hypothetical protein [Deinococcus peraridilitoris]AFZ69005.1 hypothetical protein Deipe_3575 [Deinococcus peraridilitoris DSM 19664]
MTVVPQPVSSLLREYQDYVLAYRLRVAVGGRVTPADALLSISRYARKRLERQALARALVNKEIPLSGLRDIDRLTSETAFGFWHNPSEVAEFLRAALRQGGHPALGDPGVFAGLFTPDEHQRLGDRLLPVCEYYLTCLSLAAPGIDPAALEHLYARIEAFDLPLFVDDLPQGEPTS